MLLSKCHNIPSVPSIALSQTLTPQPKFLSTRSKLRLIAMASNSSGPHGTPLLLNNYDLNRFADVANKVADAAGEVIRHYFRKKFDIIDKDDLSPVTIADQSAEEAMVSIIFDNFPSHAIYGEEKGWRCKENSADYVWVLDPIDGTKSFITGKPLFGTLIALLQNGTPILGIIDQPVFKRKMDWDNWKEHYTEWTRGVHTHLC